MDKSMMKRNIIPLVCFCILFVASNIQVLWMNELLWLCDVYGIEIKYLSPFNFSISNYENSISLLNLGAIAGIIGIFFSIFQIIENKKREQE